MQFQAVSQQLDTIENWKADHDEAMECWATESKINIMVAIYETLRRAESAIPDRVMTGKLSPEAPVLVEFFEVANKFGNLCEQLLIDAKPFIESGYLVNGFNVLKSICNEPDAGLRIPAIIRDGREMERSFTVC